MSDTYIEPVKQGRPWGRWLWRAWVVFMVVAAVANLFMHGLSNAVFVLVVWVAIPWVLWKVIARVRG